MKIRKGDIFIHDGRVYVVEQTMGRVVYLMAIDRDGSVAYDIMYFRSTVERFFIKLTI